MQWGSRKANTGVCYQVDDLWAAEAQVNWGSPEKPSRIYYKIIMCRRSESMDY